MALLRKEGEAFQLGLGSLEHASFWKGWKPVLEMKFWPSSISLGRRVGGSSSWSGI